jgi:hypothetical protein
LGTGLRILNLVFGEHKEFPTTADPFSITFVVNYTSLCVKKARLLSATIEMKLYKNDFN